MPQVVFDIITENPEIEHVAAQVHQVAVQEHRSKRRYPNREGNVRSHVRKTCQFDRDETELKYKHLFETGREGHLIYIDKAIHDD